MAEHERPVQAPAWAVQFMLGGGLGLSLYAVAGFVFDHTAFRDALDLSPLESSIHLIFAAIMLYAGFVRLDQGFIVAVLVFIGAFSLFVGVIGPTPVPGLTLEFLSDRGIVDDSWGIPHDVMHVVAGVVNLGAAWVLARALPAPRDRGVANLGHGCSSE